MNRVSKFFRLIYLKLFRINDAPQKIAVGLGIGVFFGVMPGMGPLIALFFAFLLRVNRAAALLGSLVTNTWLSIPVFFISVKAGSLMTGVGYQHIREGWGAVVKDFTLSKLFALSMRDIVVPVLSGYAVVSLSIGLIAYLVALVILKNRAKR